MRWQELSQSGQVPGPRSSHAIAAVGDKLYLFGGELQPRVPLPADLYCYDMISSSWSVVPTTGCCPGPRIAATMAAVGDKLYLYGGRTGVEMTEGAKSDLYVFDTCTKEWQPLPAAAAAGSVDGSPVAPPPRSYQAMTASTASSKLFVFGGCGSSGRLNDLWCFDILSGSWQQLSSGEAVAARGGSVLVAAADGQQLYLLGGFNGDELQDCHTFDVATNTWMCPACCSNSSSSTMALPFGRSVFGAVLHDSSSSRCGSSNGRNSGSGCGCAHDNHVVTFGGEVSPSDKGHAGAGNFTDSLQCLSPIKAPLAATVDSSSSSSSSQWHALQVTGTGPGPRGWFASAAAAAAAACNAGGGMLVHGGLGADNERRGDLFLLYMHE